ncbi:MAG: hypothetical protein GX558_06375, partial [Clostridiales bacterium]|nr:hypothetical protein [Clostridiales bacterium]
MGFSTGGSGVQGGVSLHKWFGPGVRWHTGEDTDPWRWRIRVLTDRGDIAYGKVFLGNGGFITRRWYPLFVAVRRGGQCLDELYAGGLIGRDEAAIYRAIEDEGDIDAHALKRKLAISREGNGRFEGALTRLQTRLLVTVSGEGRFLDKFGQPYGWAINRYQTVERFFGPEIDDEAAGIDP